MERKIPNNSNNNSHNKKFIIFSILLSIFVLGIFYIFHNKIIFQETHYPLKRRNALTEEEIEKILKKMKDKLR